MKIDIESLTVREVREITSLLSRTAAVPETTPLQSPFVVGGAYFIRTVTYHLTGRVVEIVGDFLVLEGAAWIADSGRFTQAIKEGKLSEVEPVGTAIVNLSSITDAFPWLHDLPVKQL